MILLVLSVLASSAEYAHPELLVETEWLAAHAGDPHVRIVDTRTIGYHESHIPGAVWLDIDESRDAAHPPTYLPDLDRFVAKLEELGIGSDTRVVFYDDRGGVYGTRPWVLLRMLGHDDAAILNGGWTKWTAEGRPVTDEVPRVDRGRFEVKMDERWIATAADVAAAIGKPGVRILDTRTPGEIDGTDLRGNPRGGAVPSSSAIHWEDTLEGEHRTLRPAAELDRLFRSEGLRADEQIITYCQGGGRAAHELFVLHLMGYDDLRLYLGSWEDWSRRAELPVER